MFDVDVITSEISNDCGPTCLQMLLKYYGIEVELKQLIEECNVGILGCTMKNLIDAARVHEIELKPWKMDGKDLIGVDRPAIIHWKYVHFCVYCGTDDNGKVVIINPDRGRYRMDPDTFAAFFTDFALFNGKPLWPDEPPAEGEVADNEA